MANKPENLWQCNLCPHPVYTKKGWLIRHLCIVHRKQRYPKDVTLKSAIDIAGECQFKAREADNG